MGYTYRKRKLSALKSKFRRNKGLNKTQAKTVRRIAKDVAMSITEKKAFGFMEENQQLFHNLPMYLPKWLNCSQGIGDPNDLVNRDARIGDELYLKSINIKLWLSNKFDRPNCMYKVFLFWYDTGTVLTDLVCFFTQTNKMLDRYNNEQISMIDQQTIFSGAEYSGKEHSYLCTMKGNWKGKKIIYNEGGTTPKKRDIGLAVVCYDAFGTLTTDNIASFAYNGLIKFADP